MVEVVTGVVEVGAVLVGVMEAGAVYVVLVVGVVV